MGILANLSYDENIKPETDRLGGGFSVLDSNVYNAEIKAAYIKESTNGALGLHCIFNIDGKEYKEVYYMTNRNKENFYKDKDGNKQYLAGFLLADSLALLSTGNPLSKLDTEEKILKLYNVEQKAEVNTAVPCVTDMHGKFVNLGIIKQLENKREKQGNEYVEVNEKRELNVTDKVFHAQTNKTVAEYRAQADKAEYIDKWKAKWVGEVRDKSKAVEGRGTAGVPKAAQSSTSLFA